MAAAEVVAAAAGDLKQQQQMELYYEKLILYDLKELVESGLDCCYQSEEASAAIAVMKGVLGQVAFVVPGKGLKIENEPVA